MEYISIITFIAGYVISELIRRLNRAENFNTQIFNKRLDVFSELYCKWNQTYQNMSRFIESIGTSGETDKSTLLVEHFSIVEPLLHYLDENALFISKELQVQCGAALLPGDGFSKEECDRYLNEIAEQNKAVTAMIEAESGMTMLNKNIKKIINYQHRSEIVDYFKKIERDNKKRNRDKDTEES